jgi:hypothetical protein
MGNEITPKSTELTARQLMGQKDAIENELKELEQLLKGVNTACFFEEYNFLLIH